MSVRFIQSLTSAAKTVKLAAVITSPKGTCVLHLDWNNTHSSQQLSEVLVRIMEALDVLDERNIYHCDVNPRTIIMDDEGKARLASGELRS